MKDGRPSAIFDIRYFVGSNSQHLGDHEVAAYGRRLAWFLNAKGLSLGAYHSLYLCFTDSEEPLKVVVSDPSFDWWFRRVFVGMPSNFMESGSRLQQSRAATVAALKAIRPDSSDAIEEADRIVAHQGGNLRFVVKSKTYKDYVLRAATNIAAHPHHSDLTLVLEDRASGELFELPPIWHGIYFLNPRSAEGIGLRELDFKKEADGRLSVAWSESLWPERPAGERIVVGPSDAYFSELIQFPR